MVHHDTISLASRGKGTYEITEKVAAIIRASGIRNGIATVFCQHTSCSLVIMENADPTARVDMENFFEKLVPENIPYFQHTYEGPDDMPSHIKMALTRTSETVPVREGRMVLGTWQGIFLWEHRAQPHNRRLHVTVLGE